VPFLHGVRDAVIPDCKNGIRDHGARRQIRLRKETTSSRIIRKTVKLNTEK
jgi:hypothetical protein